MNHNKYVILLSLLTALLLALPASAYDFMLDGLCYDMNSNGKSVTVTYENSSSPRYTSLSGALTIPSSVTYSGTTYSVTSIGDCAFAICSGLTSVTIPNSVTSIGTSAFEGCSGITSVTIPNSVTSIGYYAFSGCSSLTSVTIGNSVTSIGYYAFRGCSGLTGVYISDLAKWCAITFSDDDANPLYYAHHLYLNGSEVKDLTIPNSVTSIGNYAFYGCSGLTSVTIPNSVTSIGYDAFYGCSGLTSVTIGNSVTSIGYYAFSGCSGLTSVTIPNSVTSIGYYAFGWCSGLTSVTIPNSVTSIGGDAFSGCSGLTSVTIGNSVTSIGNYAFRGCSGLTSVTWNAKSCNDFSKSDYSPFNGLTNIKTFEFGNEVEKIPAYLCYGLSRLTSVTIPNSVTSIGTSAFDGCSGLTSVTIPNSVTSIGNYAFYGTPWFNNQPDGLVYIGLVAYKYKGTMSAGTNIVLKDGTKSISGSCFSDCSGLTSVTIPNSVTSIGDHAFFYCSGLTSVTIPNSVTSIGDGAFCGCSGLTSVTIPNSVTKIGGSAFYGCSGLTSVTIPNSVTSIGSGAFWNCSSLTSVTIPNSVTSIGERAFYKCSGLTSVTIPNSVTSIGDNAFEGCIGLTGVYISDLAKWCAITFGSDYANPLYYAHHLYLNGGEVKDLTIPNSVASIGSSAFLGCSGLTSVTIPNSVTEIGGYAFSRCSGLRSIYSYLDPAEVTLGSSVFYNVDKKQCVLYCLKRFVDAYRNAYQWRDFTNISTLIEKYVTSISFVKTATNIYYKGVEQLTVTVLPEDADEKAVNWSSSDPEVASVNQNGNVQANKLGTATVTATATDGSNVSASCQVTVTGVESIALSETSLPMYVSGTAQLTATVSPNDLIVKDVVWSSSDPEVASVDKNGNIHANKLGTATVTATATDGSNVSASCQVTVTGVQSITMKNKTQLYVQGSEKLIATIEPNDLIVNELNWTTSDANVVSVDRYGNIRGLKPGSATVTATATDGSGVSATCRVTVTGIETITLNKTSVSLYAQETEKLFATITPSDVIVKDLCWSSSRSSVVSVDRYGNIRGLSVGTATVTATATDGSGVSASCDVTVAGTSDFVLSDSELLMFVADSYRLGATFTPSDLVWKTLNWTSSDTNVATVSSDGIITARGSGTAIIIATTTDGTYLSRSCQVTVVPKYYLSAGVLEHLRGDDEAVVALPIMLDNKTSVAQLQFDFTLPEGVTIVGEFSPLTGVTYYDDCIHLDNDRKTRSHYATINHLEGSTYRALISTSQSNLALKGNHGTVANLMLHLAQYHEAGDYSILFSNIVMSGTDVNDQHTAVNYNSLVRFHYVLGDANADVDVDVADYQATARVILNLSTPRFYADAANVYNDYTINVSDLQGIVNIMAGIDPAVIKHAPKEPLPATALALVPRVLGDGRIAIALTGDVPIGALQMDLTLPHGVTLEQAVMASRNATHRVDYAALDDGTVRLIVGSPARATLEPDDEAFLVLTLAGASGGTATLGDALAVETDLTTHRLADVAFDITPTGVNDPTADRPRIYVENNLLVIESPTGGDAQLVRVNGIASPLSVTAGRNEYTLDQGVYIVRMGNTTAKIMIKP